MMCVDANQDGKVDFHEFTDRFHNPAKDIGFNVAVLLTNLSEHMPGDSRSANPLLFATHPIAVVYSAVNLMIFLGLSDFWRKRGVC